MRNASQGGGCRSRRTIALCTGNPSPKPGRFVHLCLSKGFFRSAPAGPSVPGNVPLNNYSWSAKLAGFCLDFALQLQGLLPSFGAFTEHHAPHQPSPRYTHQLFMALSGNKLFIPLTTPRVLGPAEPFHPQGANGAGHPEAGEAAPRPLLPPRGLLVLGTPAQQRAAGWGSPLATNNMLQAPEPG